MKIFYTADLHLGRSTDIRTLLGGEAISLPANKKKLDLYSISKSILRHVCKFLFLIIAVTICLSSSANANCDAPETPKDLITNTAERIYSSKHWAAFKDVEPKQCWATSLAVETLIVPADEDDELCRGFTNLSVNFEPEQFVLPEVAFQSGYMFRNYSYASLSIDGKKSIEKMLIENQFAWLNNVVEDQTVIRKMFKGKFLIIRGTSAAGHKVEDLFLLDGFRESFEAAMLACSEVVVRNQSNKIPKKTTSKRFAETM